MKKLFLLAWPIALAAVSCSNEEVVSVNNDANEIKFAVTAENATRAIADEMFCAYKLPSKFNVWALAKQKSGETYLPGKTYFANVEYSKSGEEWVATEQANVRFWPNQSGDVLDFYVMHNYNNATVKWAPEATGEAARLAVEGYTLTTTLDNQKDFIYAVETEQQKAGNNGQKTINFRHALSQVVFQARNTNKTLHIEIKSVSVKNFHNTGNFALPVKTTKTQLIDHESNKNEEAVTGTVGKWTAQTGSETTTVDVYPTTTPAPVESGYAVVKWSTTQYDGTNLTNGKDKQIADSNSKNPGDVGYVPTYDRDFSKAMLFIPQEQRAGTVTAGTDLTSDNDNPYFVVTCKIWNVADGETFNKGTDVLLYSGDAYIPVSVNWQPGKKYIYTFVFGGKNGGYDPSGNDILVPISFDVTVDDFTPVVNGEVNMVKP